MYLSAPPKHRSGYSAHLSDYTECKSQLLKVWGSSSQAEKGWLLPSGWRSDCASSGSLNILVSFSQVMVGWSWRRIDGSGPCLPKSVVAMKELKKGKLLNYSTMVRRHRSQVKEWDAGYKKLYWNSSVRWPGSALETRWGTWNKGTLFWRFSKHVPIWGNP